MKITARWLASSSVEQLRKEKLGKRGLGHEKGVK